MFGGDNIPHTGCACAAVLLELTWLTVSTRVNYLTSDDTHALLANKSTLASQHSKNASRVSSVPSHSFSSLSACPAAAACSDIHCWLVLDAFDCQPSRVFSPYLMMLFTAASCVS